MAIKAIHPKEIDLPHIGRVKYNFRSIGFLIWFQKRDFTSGIEYINALVGEKLEIEDAVVNTDQLSDEQLNAIADALIKAIVTNDDIKGLEKTSDLIPSAQLLSLHKTWEQKSEQQAAKAMRPVAKSLQRTLATTKLFEPTGHSLLFKEAERLRKQFEIPGLQAMLKMNTPIITELQRIVNPLGNTMRPLLSDFTMIGKTLATHRTAFEGISPFLAHDIMTKSVFTEMRLAQTSLKHVMPDIGLLGRFSDQYLERNMHFPGFLSTAEAGLNRLATKSVTSEILARYHDGELKDSEALNATLEAVHSLDIFDEESEFAEADIESLVTKVMGMALFIVGGENFSQHRQSIYDLAMLVLTVLSIYLASQSATREQMQQIIEQSDRIIELRQQDLEQNEHRYRNDRMLRAPFHLREGPDVESSSITILNKGQLVTTINTHGHWVYVEVIPYADQSRLTGWIYQGGLVPLGNY